MSFSVSILATGSELLDGRVVDTNSNYVAQILSELGLKLRRVLVVDDDESELLIGLRQLMDVSDIVITSGGLGPTTDDLTRDIVSKFFGVGLYEEPAGRRHLEEFYAKRGRLMDESNLKQALLPVGSTMIPNELGTAPGFSMSNAGGPVACSLSGVPREFKKMFNDSVLPLIKARATGVTELRRVNFKTFGVPESVVGKIVQSCDVPSEVTVSYRAAFPEVHVVLKYPAGFAIEDVAARVRKNLGLDVVFSEDAKASFSSAVQELLMKQGATVATAESCTGGMIGATITSLPGSSAVYKGSVVSYSNSIKERILSVPSDILASHGAVSAEVVTIMARRVRELMGTTYGIAVSGVAGPDGGTSEKPVGTFFVAVSGPTGEWSLRCLYPGERHIVRNYATYVSLDLLRRQLIGLQLPESYPILASVRDL
jgi:nicotinamide-nucleotide amidase